ncbi:hypothetical protein M2480_003136 [Parabacteroides sp. PFB2-12]|uniref:type IX secretion system protein PorG n=1 Tax=unclassified Parabacteroides TaxID=2649774 RepID=UPI0024738581|nr:MULTISPECIES: DUF6089 family protein [unclassified Parabacteroides]MDH6343210.1 hypothetical protein [Parabacteroides sp. PM6-13]MDH6392128.1 hypothetical protein [Parabacteroides sp. PFB2-12]
MTSTFLQRLFLIILGVNLFLASYAQEYKYEIGGMAGGNLYMGDANKTSLFKEINPAFGAVFRYNANFRLAFKADLMWAGVSGTTAGLKNVFPFEEEISFSRNIIEFGGHVEFNFLPYSDKFGYLNTQRITPYLLTGLGVTLAPGGDETFFSVHIPLGVGVKYKLKNRVNLGCEFAFRKLFKDNLEGNAALEDPYEIKSSVWKNKDWYTSLMFSITWDFGPRNRPCNNAESISF